MKRLFSAFIIFPSTVVSVYAAEEDVAEDVACEQRFIKSFAFGNGGRHSFQRLSLFCCSLLILFALFDIISAICFSPPFLYLTVVRLFVAAPLLFLFAIPPLPLPLPLLLSPSPSPSVLLHELATILPHSVVNICACHGNTSALSSTTCSIISGLSCSFLLW